MKVLVACECSGVVRSALRALGVDAWSNDIPLIGAALAEAMVNGA